MNDKDRRKTDMDHKGTKTRRKTIYPGHSLCLRVFVVNKGFY